MKIERIRVVAGRTLPHPLHAYANVRPEVALEAVLDAGEDPQQAAATLQRQAEQLVESHAAVLDASLREVAISQREREELSRLTQQVASNQARLSELQERQAAREVPESGGKGFLFDVTPRANVD